MLLKNDLSKITIILALSVMSLYAPIIFLGHSYIHPFHATVYPQVDNKRDFNCESSDCTSTGWTIETAYAGVLWPIEKLAVKLYSEGSLPLWNPYLGAGTPLAADSVNYPFSPVTILYFLPSYLWDIPPLIEIFLAGLFMYLFLRCLRLGFISCAIGSLFFMFSGPFSWFLLHDSVLVILFTPLILFSIEKTIQTVNVKYVFLGAISLAMSILGCHLESVFLLLFFITAYTSFRIISVISIKHDNVIFPCNDFTNRTNDKRKIILFSFFVIVGGIGLSSFLLIPTYEYLINSGSISHSQSTGLEGLPVFSIAVYFIPYLLGPIGDYLSPASLTIPTAPAIWSAFGGYVGSSILFFTILGIVTCSKIFATKREQSIIWFFSGTTLFFILKNLGVPPINWIGYVSPFQYVIFHRYDIFIIAFGFTVVAAFGIESLLRKKATTRSIKLAALISAAIILILFASFVPFLLWEKSVIYYTVFQLLESIFFILMAFLFSRSTIKGKSPLYLFFLVLLELSNYIPLGLNPVWQTYRMIATSTGVIIIFIILYLSSRYTQKKKLELKILVTTLLIIVVTQQIVYVENPIGLPLRHDPFEQTELTKFLEQNIGNSRIYTIDSAFQVNFPAAYQIQSIGFISAFNVDGFESFVHNLLDPAAINQAFGFDPGWRNPPSPTMYETLMMYKKYYDFLGVKYIVATNSSSLSYKYPPNTYISMGQYEDGINQTFVSKINNIQGIGVLFGTYNRINNGNLEFIIDSIPFDPKYHRVFTMSASNVKDVKYNVVNLDPPIIDAYNHTFSLDLKFTGSFSPNNDIALFVTDDKLPSSIPVTTIMKNIGGQLSLNGNHYDGVMTFGLQSTGLPITYDDGYFKIYENKDAFPRVYLVDQFHTVDKNKAQDYLLQNPDFDLRHNVILEKQLPSDIATNIQSSTLDGTSNANITSYDANKVVIHTNANAPSMLILTDTYYPGWKAYVDGKETMIYRADGLIRSIYVPSGSHNVEFSYLPESFIIGLSISITTAVILVGILIYSKRKSSYIKGKK